MKINKEIYGTMQRPFTFFKGTLDLNAKYTVGNAQIDLNNFPFCGGGIRWNWPPATFFNQFLNFVNHPPLLFDQ